ncbi:RutC family protein [uncultured archaeon]|nr:RutC family protein [uncultured archaeon]
MDNIKLLIEAAGRKMDDIVKVIIYMRDVKQFDKMNEVYRGYFKGGQEPARVTVQALSPIKSVDIEIEAIAIVN